MMEKKFDDMSKKERLEYLFSLLPDAYCKCQYKNDQKVENKNVHFPRSTPQLVIL